LKLRASEIKLSKNNLSQKFVGKKRVHQGMTTMSMKNNTAAVCGRKVSEKKNGIPPY